MMPEMMGRKIGGEKSPSNFAVTCNLLSQFIKHRGSIAPHPFLGGRPATTMSFLPGADVSGDAGRSAPRSMELFPRHAGISASAAVAAVGGSDARGPETGQLTIFYAGKVMVFDNFPSEKAVDLVQLATEACAAAAATAATAKRATVTPHGSSALKSTPNNTSVTAAVAQKPSQPQPATTSYLPIARKASLHRFLEKRKDRISAKAPYQSEMKKEEGEPWLGLGTQSSIDRTLARADLSVVADRA